MSNVNIKQVTIGQTTYPIKDAAARNDIADLQSKVVYYGTCDTAAATQAKTVTITGISALSTGLGVRIKFANAQTYNGTPTLNVNSLGAKTIRRDGSNNAIRYQWGAGEVLDLVYDGTYWVIVNEAIATTTYYGITKLSSAINSTSTDLAATASAVKQAYDLANGKISSSSIVTSISSSSTDAQVPSAKCLYDIVGDIETILENML